MSQIEKKINSTKLYDGKVVKLFVDEVICSNKNRATREIVKHPGGVCILAFTDNKKVIIEKQYRYAYDEEVIELPAGKLEPNEKPVDAAKREFEEETGYKVEEIEFMGCMYPTCGYSNEVIHLFYASKISKGNRHLDDDENMDIIEMPLEEIVDKIKSNEIVDAKTICLISKYLMKKES